MYHNILFLFKEFILSIGLVFWPLAGVAFLIGYFLYKKFDDLLWLKKRKIKIANCDKRFSHKFIKVSEAKFAKNQAIIKSLIAAAPLLGLLGTVSGMIETFDSLSVVATSTGSGIAGGISKALLTTQIGIVISVPSILAYRYMLNEAKSVLEHMEVLMGDYDEA